MITFKLINHRSIYSFCYTSLDDKKERIIHKNYHTFIVFVISLERVPNLCGARPSRQELRLNAKSEGRARIGSDIVDPYMNIWVVIPASCRLSYPDPSYFHDSLKFCMLIKDSHFVG